MNSLVLLIDRHMNIYSLTSLIIVITISGYTLLYSQDHTPGLAFGDRLQPVPGDLPRRTCIRKGLRNTDIRKKKSARRIFQPVLYNAGNQAGNDGSCKGCPRPIGPGMGIGDRIG